MKSKTLEEIHKRRQVLDQEIYELIKTFEHVCKVTVDSIELHKTKTLSDRYEKIIMVKTSIKL